MECSTLELHDDLDRLLDKCDTVCDELEHKTIDELTATIDTTAESHQQLAESLSELDDAASSLRRHWANLESYHRESEKLQQISFKVQQIWESRPAAHRHESADIEAALSQQSTEALQSTLEVGQHMAIVQTELDAFRELRDSLHSGILTKAEGVFVDTSALELRSAELPTQDEPSEGHGTQSPSPLKGPGSLLSHADWAGDTADRVDQTARYDACPQATCLPAVCRAGTMQGRLVAKHHANTSDMGVPGTPLCRNPSQGRGHRVLGA